MPYSNMLAVECGMGNKGRKAGTGLSLCNRFDTRKPENNLKKCSRSPRNTKRTTDPSSPLMSSTCSSNASPARTPARSYSKRGQLLVEKSLDWDSAFFTNEGLLNTEEMSKINKGFAKASGTRKAHVQSESVGSRRLSILRKTVDWDTAFPGEGLLNPQELFMVNEGFKKAESSQSLTTKTNSKVRHSNKSSSSGSPKCIRSKINYKNTKPTTCSSETSSASSSHAVLSPLNYQLPPQHPLCHNSKERKFTSQDATRSSIRNVMPSLLRMPSPRLGFFDEEPRVQLTNKVSMQKPNVFPAVECRPSFLPFSLVQVC